MNNSSSELFVLAIDCGVGIVGFGASLAWGKIAGRTMDRDTVRFLALLWGGIAAFGAVMTLIM